MSTYHLDYETTSACDIKLGAYRYAADPSTRILMFAVSRDDGPPLLWSFIDPCCEESLAAEAMLKEALGTRSLIYAHNAAFELAITTYRLKADCGIDPPPLEVWRCTQAMCKRAAAPESLAKASEFFGLADKKDAAGKALINVFSNQTKTVVLSPPPGMKDPVTRKKLKNGRWTSGCKPKNHKSASPILEDPVRWNWLLKVDGEMITVREAWDKFCGYCLQDVRAEHELCTLLKRFELKGDILESFQFDLHMNHKGVPVNVEALRNADNLIKTLHKKLSARFRGHTKLNPSQRDKTLAWLRERGYPEENLQAGTVTDVLENPPEEMSPTAVEMLRAYSLLQFAALKKIPTMLGAVGPGDVVRGTTQWHAARTGRAGGRIIQPQNFRRATVKDSDLCYRMVREKWDPLWFETLWSSPMEAIASSIRHFIQPHEGKFLSCDFASIEARLAPWLVSDEQKLRSILDGVDQYKVVAAAIYGKPYGEIRKPSKERDVGKRSELACIYGVGAKGLKHALWELEKVDVDLTEAKRIVKVYRELHPKTIDAWREIQHAAEKSVRTPLKKFPACDGKVEFQSGRIAGINYMTLRLPSGRRMFYPNPKIKRVFKKYDEEDMEAEPWKREKGGYWINELSFEGKRPVTGQWGRVPTFAAKLFENVVQAMGVDLLNYGCIQCEREGLDIRMIIHDEILALDDGRPTEEWIKVFCRKPGWAQDFMLDATGGKVNYYTK